MHQPDLLVAVGIPGTVLTPVFGTGIPEREVLLRLESFTPSGGALDMRRACRIGGELMLRVQRQTGALLMLYWFRDLSLGEVSNECRMEL